MGRFPGEVWKRRRGNFKNSVGSAILPKISSSTPVGEREGEKEGRKGVTRPERERAERREQHYTVKIVPVKRVSAPPLGAGGLSCLSGLSLSIWRMAEEGDMV